MVSEAQKSPQILVRSAEFANLIDDVQLIKLSHRLLYKIGFKQERPQMELAGPITDEAFPESKILFFSWPLEDPDASTPRIREFGAFSAIFLVFPSDEINEVLQAYNELSHSLKTFIKDIKTLKDFTEQSHTVEVIINQSILRSALNQILDELMLIRGFKDVFVIAQDGSNLAQASRSRDKEDESRLSKRVGAVSALSIAERILERMNELDQNPLFICQTQNETLIALKMGWGGIVASIEERIITFQGRDTFVDALRQASSKISSLLQQAAGGIGLFSMIQEQIPEVQILMVSNNEGVALAFKNVTEKPHEIASMINVFYSNLIDAGHDYKEIAVIEGKDSYLLIGELRKDTILSIQIPKRRELDEYIFKMQDFLRYEKNRSWKR